MPKVLLVFKKAFKERSTGDKKVGKALEPVPSKILMMKYKLVKCTEHWLKCQGISVERSLAEPLKKQLKSKCCLNLH